MDEESDGESTEEDEVTGVERDEELESEEVGEEKRMRSDAQRL